MSCDVKFVCGRYTQIHSLSPTTFTLTLAQTLTENIAAVAVVVVAFLFVFGIYAGRRVCCEDIHYVCAAAYPASTRPDAPPTHRTSVLPYSSTQLHSAITHAEQGA